MCILTETQPSTMTLTSKSDDHYDGLPTVSTNSAYSSSITQDKTLASSKVPFAWKLHIMLADAEKSGNEHIVCWVDSGRGFQVNDLDAFMSLIVPSYFKQTKWKSFQRQLYFYGYTRHASGAYYHPKFLKGAKTLSLAMKPKKISRRKKREEKQQANSATNVSSPPTEQARTKEVHHDQLSSSNIDHSDWMTTIDRLLENHPPFTASHMSSINTELSEGDRVFVFGERSFHYVFKHSKYI